MCKSKAENLMTQTAGVAKDKTLGADVIKQIKNS